MSIIFETLTLFVALAILQTPACLLKVFTTILAFDHIYLLSRISKTYPVLYSKYVEIIKLGRVLILSLPKVKPCVRKMEWGSLNYVYGCFARIDICVLYICLVLMEVKRKHQITGTEISDKIISCCMSSESQTLVLCKKSKCLFLTCEHLSVPNHKW